MPKKQTDDKQKEEVKEEKNEVSVKQETSVSASEDDYSDIDLEEYGLTEDDLDDLTGLATINANDIRVPYGKLYSKKTGDLEVGDIELPNGNVIKGLSGEVIKGLSILKIQPVRIYFPTPYKKGNTFICRSNDGIKGAPEGKYAGTPCATCEFSKYPEEGGASPCRDQRLLLCTLPDGLMFHMLVSGIGVGEFKEQFMSVDMPLGLRTVKKKLKRNILGALNITVSVEMKSTDNGDFPYMVFKVDKDRPMVNKDRLMMNLGAFSSYKEFEDEAVASSATFAQHEQGDVIDAEEAAGQNNEMF